MRRNRYLWTWREYAQEVLWWLGGAVIVALAMPLVGLALKLIWMGLMFGWGLL